MAAPEPTPAILIVDDHSVMRGLLSTFLRSVCGDCRISEAGSGSRAMVLLRSRQPNVVLMDIQLGDANGLELTRQIRQQWPEVRVLVVTQHDSQMHREHARSAGASGLILKDRIYTDLLPMLRSFTLLPSPSMEVR